MAPGSLVVSADGRLTGTLGVGTDDSAFQGRLVRDGAQAATRIVGTLTRGFGTPASRSMFVVMSKATAGATFAQDPDGTGMWRVKSLLLPELPLARARCHRRRHRRRARRHHQRGRADLDRQRDRPLGVHRHAHPRHGRQLLRHALDSCVRRDQHVQRPDEPGQEPHARRHRAAALRRAAARPLRDGPPAGRRCAEPTAAAAGHVGARQPPGAGRAGYGGRIPGRHDRARPRRRDHRRRADRARWPGRHDRRGQLQHRGRPAKPSSRCSPKCGRSPSSARCSRA